MQFLGKKTNTQFQFAPSINKELLQIESLFVECVNFTKEHMQSTIAYNRPLFEWYAEHLGTKHTKAIITKDRYAQALIEKEMQRLDLLNSPLLYATVSDAEIERPQTPFRGD